MLPTLRAPRLWAFAGDFCWRNSERHHHQQQQRCHKDSHRRDLYTKDSSEFFVVSERCGEMKWSPLTLSLLRDSDQCQISPAASPEIFHHTVWRTWLFIAYSDERWLYYQFSPPHSYIFSIKGRENVLFELRSERVEDPIGKQKERFSTPHCTVVYFQWPLHRASIWSTHCYECVGLSGTNRTASCLGDYFNNAFGKYWSCWSVKSRKPKPPSSFCGRLYKPVVTMRRQIPTTLCNYTFLDFRSASGLISMHMT